MAWAGVGARRNVFFVMDEFALLPQLAHISDGVNFGRSLGLKFIVGTQNVDQILHAYGAEIGRSIIAGFALAFRLILDRRESRRVRALWLQPQTVDHRPRRPFAGVRQEVVLGNVIEDFSLLLLRVGECVLSLPEGAPFLSFQ